VVRTRAGEALIAQRAPGASMSNRLTMISEAIMMGHFQYRPQFKGGHPAALTIPRGAPTLAPPCGRREASHAHR